MLGKNECSVLRGLAIISIALHNYCHWLPGIMRENEFAWLPQLNTQMMQILSHPDSLLPIHLLAFFGHYGVSIFLFLSGYGLVMSYERSNPIGTWPFVKRHFIKLFRLVVIGFTIFVLVDALCPSSYHFNWKEIVGTLTMTINLRSLPNPGPYWFFGLMLQLYLLYRLVFYRWRHWAVVAIAVAASLILQALYIDQNDTLKLLKMNCVGNILPFVLGLLAGRHLSTLKLMSKPLAAILTLTAVVLTFIMGLNCYTWLLIPLPVIVGGIAILRLIPSACFKPLAWTGTLSAYIFIAHPTARRVIIFSYLNQAYVGLLLYALLTIGLSWVLYQLVARLTAHYRRHC